MEERTEEKLEKKEKKPKNVAGLLALAISLFLLAYLVVYPKLVRPAVKTYQAESEREKAVAEAEKEFEEKQSEWENLVSPEEDWTVEDYDRTLKETVIDKQNNDESATLLGWVIEPEDDQALQFYDCYVTNKDDSENRKWNEMADLVVRYTVNDPSKSGICSIDVRFTMDEQLYYNFSNHDRYYINAAEDFIDYITSNRDLIYFDSQSAASADGIDDLPAWLNRHSDNSLVCYTAEDFANLSDYVPTTEKE